MLLQGTVGPTVNADGVNANARQGKQGDVITSELHGRYYEQTYRGNVFFAASQAVATTTVGLAATYTGLALTNPIGSTVNLVINKVSLMQSLIQSTQVEAYAIATGFSATTQVTQTTPVTPHTSKIGSGLTPQGLAASSATLPVAPVYTTFLGATSTATADPTSNVTDLEGSLILMPGAYLCFVTPAQASVAGLWFSVSWEEVTL